ncbi:MAG TPA: hypothetical protein VGG45_02355 [Terracidiphilus sp.]
MGSATGLTLALVNASNSALAASNNTTPVDSDQVRAIPADRLAMNASPAQVDRPVVTASSVASPSNPATAISATPAVESHKAVSNLAPKLAAASSDRPIKVSSEREMALNKAPDAVKPSTIQLEGKEYRAARMVFEPAAMSATEEPVSAEAAVPTAVNTAQLSLELPTPASLYTEGELTVSEFNASTGTIETSDGKTFVLGTTVAAGNATSWETYRSDLHYRCDQNGSCVLMRAGVVAPNARLI